MQRLRSVFTVTLLVLTMANAFSQNNSGQHTSAPRVFVGSTPCSQGTRPLPGIPINADCELIKWKLTLYQDKSAKAPRTYKLRCLYGLPEQGTTGLTGGGKIIELEGKWTIVKGTASKPQAIIYQLHDSKTNQTISLLKLNDNLLHLLDNDLRLMIGSAAWSYTLNSRNQ